MSEEILSQQCLGNMFEMHSFAMRLKSKKKLCLIYLMQVKEVVSVKAQVE